MPLLNGELFVKTQPPEDLSLDEELFFLPTTLEIFRNYDDYFERTILVNSVTWNCSSCHRGPFTYNEALICEQGDQKKLNAFGSALSSGLLHIINNAKKQRLPDLIELLSAFCTTRYFCGEVVEFQKPDVNSRALGVIDRIILTQPRKQFEEVEDETLGGQSFVEASKLQYSLHEHRKLQGHNKEQSINFILSMSSIQRRNRNILLRDNLKFFIRQTCELKAGVFVPKDSFMQRYRLHPHGLRTWTDLFILPEPHWSSVKVPLMLHRNHAQPFKVSNQLIGSQSKFGHYNGEIDNHVNHQHHQHQHHHHHTNSYRIIDNFHGAKNASSAGMSLIPDGRAAYQQAVPCPVWDKSRLIRAERLHLEREWSSLRRREDLELSDLALLPEFPQFSTNIDPNDLGTVLQLLEFFHIFGVYLGLIIPSPAVENSEQILFVRMTNTPDAPLLVSLTLDQLVTSLVESNPCGSLVDIFISLLSTIRRLELDINSRQTTPSSLSASYTAASAVAAAEAGLNATMMIQNADDTTTTNNNEEDECPEADSSLMRVFREAAISTRLCELVGIPNQTASSAASKAVMTAISVLSAKDENVTLPSQLSTNAGNRSSVTRAATMAVAAGAASHPPLDRAGLSEVLWLHFTGAAAKGGGWRGQIWGGTRPLDDPSVMLARNEPVLVEKLKTTPVFKLTPHEKITLLTSLMDELLLQSQVRDRVDDNFERLRLLRIQLRAIQSDRAQLSASFVSSRLHDDADRQDDGELGADGDESIENGIQLATFGSRGAGSGVGRGRGGVRGRPAGSGRHSGLGRPPGKKIVWNSESLESCLPNHDLDFTLPKLSHSESDSQFDTLHDKLAKNVREEQKIWDALTQVSRGCSMIPLGQDRFYRRYWLVMSIPCIVIEQTPQSELPNLGIRNRQISYAYPELASYLGLEVVHDCTQHMHDVIKSIVDQEYLDRDELTYRLAAALPNPTNGGLTLEQLRTLVRLERARPSEMSLHTQCPVVLQFDRFYCGLKPSSPHSSDSIWSIVTPMKPPDAKCDGGFKKTESDEVEQSPSSSKCQAWSDEELMAAATWTMDCIESTLNVRGIREGRLRLTLGQLRPLLIKVVSLCPKRYWTKSTIGAVESESVKLKPEESTLRLDASADTSADNDVVNLTMIKWLETALVGVACRLGRMELAKLFVDSKSIWNVDIGSDAGGEACLSKVKEEEGDTKPPPTPTDAAADDNNHSMSVVLKRLSNFLLAVGHSIGSKSIAGPLSNEEKTLRGLLVPAHVASNLQQGADPSSLDVSENMAADTESNNFVMLPLQTTGWQRWCASVEQARSTAQIHLLARALERCVRRASMGGRGVPAAVAAHMVQNPLPPLVCTMCFHPPEPQYSLNNSHHIFASFSTCSGCGCPYHLDCLLKSPPPLSSVDSDARPNWLSILDPLMTGHYGTHSSMSSITSARIETTGGGLILCAICWKTAVSVQTDADGGAKLGVDRLMELYEGRKDLFEIKRKAVPVDLGEQFKESKKSSSVKPHSPTDSTLNGVINHDDDYDDDNDDDDGEDDEDAVTQSTADSHFADTAIDPSATVKSLLNIPRSSAFPLRTSYSNLGGHHLRTRGRGSGGSSGGGRRGRGRGRGHRGRGRGRPPLRPRRVARRLDVDDDSDGDDEYVDEYVIELQEQRPQDHETDGDGESDTLCITVDVAYDDEMEDLMKKANNKTNVVQSLIMNPSALTDVKKKILVKRTSSSHPEDCLNSSSHTSSSPAAASPAVRGRGRPRGRPSLPRSIIAPPRSSPPNAIPSFDAFLSDAAFADLFNQLDVASRFMTELCNLSSARPLLRCGLGRSIGDDDGDDDDDDDDDEVVSKRSNQLQAFDLSGLQDLLTRNELPRGPIQVISQLKLLLSHWIRQNRPGSRLHQCAVDLGSQMLQKLKSIQRQHNIDLVPEQSPAELPKRRRLF